MQALQSTFRSEGHHVIPAVKLFIFQRPTQHQQSAQIPHHLNTQNRYYPNSAKIDNSPIRLCEPGAQLFPTTY